ncbi:unnamed protein product [Calypogeia fissa]
MSSYLEMGTYTPTSRHVFLLSAGLAQSIWRSALFADWLSRNRERLYEMRLSFDNLCNEVGESFPAYYSQM